MGLCPKCPWLPWQQELGSEPTLLLPGSGGDHGGQSAEERLPGEIPWGIRLEMGQESALAQTLLGLPSKTEQVLALRRYFWPLHLTRCPLVFSTPAEMSSVYVKWELIKSIRRIQMD